MKPMAKALAALILAGGLASAACGMDGGYGVSPMAGGYAGSLQAQGVGGRFGAGSTSLFVEPDDGEAPVLDAINGAQRSIQLEVYMLTNRDVEQALLGAVQRGVRVQVILERHPYMGTPAPGQPVGNPNYGAYGLLQRGGAQVQWSDPRFTYTHEKAMVIDGHEAVIMSLNLTGSGLGKNREYGVVDQDPQDVFEVANIFAADWSGGDYQPSDPNLVVSPDDSRQRLTSLISSARQSLVVEDEECNDPSIIQLLGQKAQQGVNVQVELAGDSGASQEVSALNAAGVSQVKLLHTPYLHAKLIIVDGQAAYVGSINLSANSMDHNREVGIILNDPSEVGRLVQVANGDWSQGQ